MQATGAAEPVLPEIGGHKVVVGRVHWALPMFEDGRIAHKHFVDVSDDTAKSGEFKGYSTYTFAERRLAHAELHRRLERQAALPDDYKVIAGTGAFAGATGTGHFEAADEKWEKAMLWDGSFSLTLPTQ